MAAAGPALGHAVYVFAWAEGERICTDSYFTRSSPVLSGEVIMSAADGTELARAITDDDGQACFPRPRVEGDLLFAVLAGQGHKGQFTLRADELPPLTGGGPSAPPDPAETAPTPETAPTEPGASSSAPATAAGADAPAAGPAGPADTVGTDGPVGPAPDLEAIRAMIRQELGAQLGPINRRLTMEATDESPTLKSVIGGLGWVVGIFGLAFWWTGRKARSGR
jgi:nickel transport protein